MSLCAECGLLLIGESELCAHHPGVHGDNWAANNRIMCDFFHRARVPPRLIRIAREDDLWPTSEVA